MKEDVAKLLHAALTSLEYSMFFSVDDGFKTHKRTRTLIDELTKIINDLEKSEVD